MSIEYRPLDPSKNEIRLLKLHPHNQTGDSIPVCDMFHASLLDKPQFIALSYVWGDQTKTRTILLGNSQVLVTQNVYEVLVALRSSKEPLVMWIDYLCINQADDIEKSSQVGLMADIYRQSEQTLAWLGPADCDSDSVMDYLNFFGEMAVACGIDEGYELCKEIWSELVSGITAVHEWRQPHIVFETLSGGTRTISRKGLENLFYFIGGLQDQDRIIPVDGLSHLLKRAWWGRAWVLQEITLPERAQFVCGAKRITRRRFRAAVNAHYALWLILMHRGYEIRPLATHQLQACLHLHHHRPLVMLSSRNIYRYHRFCLAALLRATCVGSHNLDRHGPHHLEATDPRDKIFALLSLASDREDLKRRGLFPDYTQNTKEVYTRAMIALLQQGHISLLSLCQHPKFQQGLPSWVPDWSGCFTHMFQHVRQDHMTIYPEFRASGTQPYRSKVGIGPIGGGNQRICLECSIYDEIYEAGKFPSRGSSKEVPLFETFKWPTPWLKEIFRLSAVVDRGYADLEGRLRAVARTSIGDSGWDQQGEITRIGHDRFYDALFLLQKSLKRVTEEPFQSEVRRLFAKRAIKGKLKGGARASMRFSSEIIGKSLGRIPFVTKKGHLVLSYEYAQPGDLVALIRGAQVPYILRPQSCGAYQLVGEAYVDGIMDGEAADVAGFGIIDLV